MSEPPHSNEDSPAATPSAGGPSGLATALPATRSIQLRDPDAPEDRPGDPSRPLAESSRYRLGREIARGGMGAILEGRDVDLGRSVAVKVLLDTHQDRAEFLHRFVEEAQISGQLQHPGVVPIYELGLLPDGRPFFTMKLVKGRTLAKILAEREGPSSGRGRLLKVFEQVCQTLAFAHSRGVIHRDLKPANVMVGAYGEVQVMDWGLAKVLDESGAKKDNEGQPAASVIRTRRAGDNGSAEATQTQAGSVLGTPAYMPPEQALGEVDRLDERCDVFGLGAILCQILTGKPPYADADTAKVLRKAARADLADAFARLDGCGADPELATLCRRCLAAEPDERPRDAGVLAAELTAHLEGVEARLRQAELAGAEARARTQEERKRRKLTVALAGAVLLMVLLGGGGWLWVSQYRAGLEREALKRDAEDRAAREREESVRRVETARQVRKVLDRAIERRDLARAGNDPGRWAEARALAEQAENLLAATAGEDELAGRVRTLRGELDEEERDRELIVSLERLWFERARARARALPEYARAFAEHGFRADAKAADNVAWVRRRPPETRERLLCGLDAWFLSARQARSPDAGRLFAVLQASDENAQRRELRAAVAKNDPKEVDRVAPPQAWGKLGPEAVMLLFGHLVGRSFDQAIALLRVALERFPGDFHVNVNLANALSARNAHYLADNDQYEEPLRYYTAAVALRPNDPNVLESLGDCLAGRGRIDEAVKTLQRAVALWPGSATTQALLAHLLYSQGHLEQADQRLAEALRLEPENGYVHSRIALIRRDQCRYDEGIAAWRHHISQRQGGPTAHINLAGILWRKGRRDEAIEELREAQRSHKDYPAVPFFLQLCQFLEADRFEQAEALTRGAVPRQPENPFGHLGLFLALFAQGRLDDALKAIQRCAELSRKTPAIGSFPSGWAKETEAIIVLAPKLGSYLEGKAKPRDAAERELLLYVCTTKKLFAGATRLYADAFAADEKLADDLLGEHRCDAARCAARAAAGLGDGADLGEKERARLRGQALAWLQADLAARMEQKKSTSLAERSAATERLRWWQRDPALAGVRDQAALQKLSEQERGAWAKFWKDVAAASR